MPGDSFNQTVATILAGTLAPANSPSELCYHKLWSREIAGEANPLVAAARGGALADRPAWIFQAGYQAAIRRVFGEVAPDGWAAYLVSEDASGNLPAVTCSADGDDVLLSGHKTWVAASDHVRHLLVSLEVRGERRFALLDRQQEGVSVESYDRAGYLGDMSQGRANFAGVRVRPEALLPARSFGNAEPLHVLAAAAAFMLSHALRHRGPCDTDRPCAGGTRSHSGAGYHPAR